MPTILHTDKELVQTFQPLLLARFTFADASVLRLATHSLDDFPYDSNQYLPRILKQNIAAVQALSSQGASIVPSVTLRLADPDGLIYTNYEANAARGFEGAAVELELVFWEQGTANFSSDSAVKMRGVANGPQIQDGFLEVVVDNRLNLQKLLLPSVRIGRRCPLPFPATVAQREAAANDQGSRFFLCGYSPDATGGEARGNFESGSTPFGACEFTKRACDARGMYTQDSLARATGSFMGIQYDPPGRRTRPVGGDFENLEGGSNTAKYSDFFPLVYGRQWVEPPVMNVERDGNLTAFECVISQGWVNDAGALRVVVNDVEIFKGGQGGNEIAGFWNWLSTGTRRGVPSIHPFYTSRGDPYGNLAAIVVTVPRALHDSADAPKVRVLGQGRRVWTYTDVSTRVITWTDSQSWILLDLLREAGLTVGDIGLQSFIDEAAYAAVSINYQDFNDATQSHARFKGGRVLRRRRSAAEVIRGVLNGFRADLIPNAESGKLDLHVRKTLADQQPAPVSGSNYDTAIASVNAAGVATNGYVAYRFDESTIARPEGGGSFVTVKPPKVRDTPNTVFVEFQDEARQYRTESVPIRDTQAIERAGKEVPTTLAIDGLVNYDQVKRVAATYLAEGLRGNPRGDHFGNYPFEWETSVRGLHLKANQIVLLQYSKLSLNDGLESPPATPIYGVLVRIQKIQPTANYERIRISATWHQDAWYVDTFGQEPDPDPSLQERDQLARPPFPWQGSQTQPDTLDPVYGREEYFFGVAQEYTDLADASKLAQVKVTGKLPLNGFSAATQPPAVPIQGTSASVGGTIAGDKTYWIAICSKDLFGVLSAASPTIQVSVPAGTNTNTITAPDLSWPSDAVGYVVFAGLDPNALTFQSEDATTPSSITVTSLNERHWGPPDGEFNLLRIKAKRIAHSGVFGIQISSLTATTITVTNALWTTNEWADRFVSVIGLDNSSAAIPIANVKVASNTSDTLTLAASQPDLTALGVTAGDVIAMRMQATAVTATTIRDTKFDNSLALESQQQITAASNATPIQITVANHGYLTGDKVRVTLVEGNTAANGIFLVSKVDADTFELDGSVGNGAYTGNGVARRLTGGLVVDAEIGFLIRVIGGTGRGQVRKIVDNDADTYTIDRAWDTTPDATSIWIVEHPEWSRVAESTPIDNKTRDIVTSLDLEVANFQDEVMLILPVGVDGGGAESFEHLSQAREVFIFGGERPAEFQTGVRLVVDGTLAIASDIAPLTQLNREASAIAVRAEVKTAPTGDDIDLDIYVNAVLWMNLTIPAGSTSVTANQSQITGAAKIGANENVRLDLTSVGTTVPGADLVVSIYL